MCNRTIYTYDKGCGHKFSHLDYKCREAMAGEDCFDTETVESIKGNCRACRENPELEREIWLARHKADMEESRKKEEEMMGGGEKEKDENQKQGDDSKKKQDETGDGKLQGQVKTEGCAGS